MLPRYFSCLQLKKKMRIIGVYNAAALGPTNTQRNKHVIITSKRRFDVIITCLLRFVFTRGVLFDAVAQLLLPMTTLWIRFPHYWHFVPGIHRWLLLGWLNWALEQTVEWPVTWDALTHWGRVTHICVNELTIIVSDNGLSPIRRQAIIGTNAE